jgi:hypothetical protein
MNNIQLIDCGYEAYEVDMVSLRNVLDLLHSLKSNGAYFNQKTKRWAMHSSLVEKFSKLVKEHACILEPIIKVEDAHPYTKKPVNQLTIKQYYGGNEYCVRLDKFEKGVVETIKAIDGAYYLAHGGWWIIDSKFYDPLIKQIKVRFPQIKINDQLDKMETP